MRDVRAGEIESALDMQSRFRFHMLREHFAQNNLFGEILATDYQRLAAR